MSYNEHCKWKDKLMTSQSVVSPECDKLPCNEWVSTMSSHTNKISCSSASYSLVNSKRVVWQKGGRKESTWKKSLWRSPDCTSLLPPILSNKHKVSLKVYLRNWEEKWKINKHFSSTPLRFLEIVELQARPKGGPGFPQIPQLMQQREEGDIQWQAGRAAGATKCVQDRPHRRYTEPGSKDLWNESFQKFGHYQVRKQICPGSEGQQLQLSPFCELAV